MNDKLLKLIRSNRQLFWDIGEKDLTSLNQEAIVERFMAYGDMLDINELEKVISKVDIKRIFDKITEKSRVNLEPETINFFNIYLSRNAG